MLLIGNKCDLSNDKQVNTESAQEFANEKKMEFFEVSAKTAEQVNFAFEVFSKKLMDKRDTVLKSKKRSKKRRSSSSKVEFY